MKKYLWANEMKTDENHYQMPIAFSEGPHDSLP